MCLDFHTRVRETERLGFQWEKPEKERDVSFLLEERESGRGGFCNYLELMWQLGTKDLRFVSVSARVP